MSPLERYARWLLFVVVIGVSPFVIQALLYIMAKHSPPPRFTIPSDSFNQFLFGKGALLISCVAVIADGSSELIAVDATGSYSKLAKVGGISAFLLVILGAAVFGAVTAFPDFFEEALVTNFSMWFFLVS